MDNVIDFESARIRLRSKVKDPVIVQDMLDNAYDPCNLDEVEAYWMRERLVEALAEGLSFEFEQDYIYEPDLSAFFDDEK